MYLHVPKLTHVPSPEIMLSLKILPPSSGDARLVYEHRKVHDHYQNHARDGGSCLTFDLFVVMGTLTIMRERNDFL